MPSGSFSAASLPGLPPGPGPRVYYGKSQLLDSQLFNFQFGNLDVDKICHFLRLVLPILTKFYRFGKKFNFGQSCNFGSFRSLTRVPFEGREHPYIVRKSEKFLDMGELTFHAEKTAS